MPHSGGTPESLIICLAAIKGKYRFNALKVIKKLMISGPLYFRGEPTGNRWGQVINGALNKIEVRLRRRKAGTSFLLLLLLLLEVNSDAGGYVN